VVIVPDGIHAGAVADTRFGHGFERPLISGPYRKARRAIPLHRATGRVFEYRLGEAYVGEELSVSLVGCPKVLVAVARELVPALDNSTDQPGIGFRNPSHGEERRSYGATGEKLQNVVDIALA